MGGPDMAPHTPTLGRAPPGALLDPPGGDAASYNPRHGADTPRASAGKPRQEGATS